MLAQGSSCRQAAAGSRSPGRPWQLPHSVFHTAGAPALLSWRGRRLSWRSWCSSSSAHDDAMAGHSASGQIILPIFSPDSVRLTKPGACERRLKSLTKLSEAILARRTTVDSTGSTARSGNNARRVFVSGSYGNCSASAQSRPSPARCIRGGTHRRNCAETIFPLSWRQ